MNAGDNPTQQTIGRSFPTALSRARGTARNGSKLIAKAAYVTLREGNLKDALRSQGGDQSSSAPGCLLFGRDHPRPVQHRGRVDLAHAEFYRREPLCQCRVTLGNRPSFNGAKLAGFDAWMIRPPARARVPPCKRYPGEVCAGDGPAFRARPGRGTGATASAKGENSPPIPTTDWLQIQPPSMWGNRTFYDMCLNLLACSAFHFLR